MDTNSSKYRRCRIGFALPMLYEGELAEHWTALNPTKYFGLSVFNLMRAD